MQCHETEHWMCVVFFKKIKKFFPSTYINLMAFFGAVCRPPGWRLGVSIFRKKERANAKPKSISSRNRWVSSICSFLRLLYFEKVE